MEAETLTATKYPSEPLKCQDIENYGQSGGKYDLNRQIPNGQLGHDGLWEL